MNTEEMSRERISAFADGELAGLHIDTALISLRHQSGRNDWDIYHQIGDVLRSDDMATALSPRFSARMAALLDAEPAIVAPVISSEPSIPNVSHSSTQQVMVAMVNEGRGRPAARWLMPGMAAAAAMAAIAFVATPQLMVAMKDDVKAGPPALASSATVATGKLVQAGSGSKQGAVLLTSASEDVVLRDPRIDDYLLAHQRFSPSVYSTAQYARSATLATDSNK